MVLITITDFIWLIEVSAFYIAISFVCCALTDIAWVGSIMKSSVLKFACFHNLNFRCRDKWKRLQRDWPFCRHLLVTFYCIFLVKQNFPGIFIRHTCKSYKINWISFHCTKNNQKSDYKWNAVVFIVLNNLTLGNSLCLCNRISQWIDPKKERGMKKELIDMESKSMFRAIAGV